MTTPLRIRDLASAVRSKNAGIHYITFDIMFDDWESYRLVRDANVITRESVAALYGIPQAQVITVVNHDPGQGIKVTILRRQSSGSPGDPDVLGCQQHAPLYDIEVPAGGAAVSPGVRGP
ncbi:MAG: DUF4387 domain-containing protein [Armatimonadetes bacterium]|nr:DUF4387 domain-containing protein [Armatimonadota bacterium]